MNPFSIQKILVPLDLSQTSLNALDTAVALAKKHNATIMLLNVIEPVLYASDETNLHVDELSNSVDVLTVLAATVQQAGNIKTKIIQLEGNVTDTIIKNSLLHRSDLIVMGTHGASGFRSGFIGSNAYNVAKHSSCPVLIVPPNRKYLSFKKVVFPVRPVTGALLRYDVACHFLSTSSSIDVLGLSYGMIEGQTNLLKKIIEEIKEQLEIDKVKAKSVWGMGQSIAEDVLLYVQQVNPDLVIVTSVLDVITKPDFLGPHTQRILNCSKAPVLCIKKIGVPVLS
jgi:nucleotide-binding universal stress UspA family protein